MVRPYMHIVSLHKIYHSAGLWRVQPQSDRLPIWDGRGQESEDDDQQ